MNFKRKTFPLFHMNLCPLTKNFDDFNIFLNDLNVSFDILAIKESHIKKDSSRPINLQLNNYSIKHTPTETSAGKSLLYISKKIPHQPGNDLKLYPCRKC